MPQTAYAIVNSKGEIAVASGRLLILTDRVQADRMVRQNPGNRVVEVQVSTAEVVLN